MVGGEVAATFYAIRIYIYKWRRVVCDGIAASIADLYQEVEERLDEVHCFVRIRGAAYKILKYIEDILMDRESIWNTQATNNAKSITELNDKEGEIKGPPLRCSIREGEWIFRISARRRVGRKSPTSSRHRKGEMSCEHLPPRRGGGGKQ